MSWQFTLYLLIAATSWSIALWLVTVRNAFDLSRCVGWYLLLFAITYLLRPAGSQLVGDTVLYDALKIGSFEDHWYLMAIAVPIAIISFGIGYRLVTSAPNSDAPVAHPKMIGERQALILVYVLLFWGYVITAKTLGPGGSGVEKYGLVGASNQGVYEHTTAWIEEGNLYVSAGSTLFFILTGRLGMSLVLAGPWLVVRMTKGWNRINIVGHVLALTGVYYSRVARSSRPSKLQVAVLMSSFVIVVLVLFPLLAMLRGIKAQTGVGPMDALAIALKRFTVADLASAYLGTNSFLSGFEPSFYHLLMDKWPELGIQYLYYFLIAPIPRMLWHGKGTPYEWPLRLLGIEWDPTVAMMGMDAGAIGFAYEQWGWLGIPAEFLFTGWLFRWAEERAREKPDAAYVQLGYAGFYSLVPQLGRTTLLTMIAKRWLFVYGIPVFILWWIHQSALARQRRVAAIPLLAPALSSEIGGRA
jgi:hypothetical protein